MSKKYDLIPILNIKSDTDKRKECDCCEGSTDLKLIETGNTFVKTTRTRSVVLCDKCRIELGVLLNLDLAEQCKAKNKALKEILNLVPEKDSELVDEIFSNN